MGHRSADATAAELAAQIEALEAPSTSSIRALRRSASRKLRDSSGPAVIDAAVGLVGSHRWVAYELIYHHPAALATLDHSTVERLGENLTDWGSVDAFARYIAGPAWQRDQIDAQLIASWARSPDRWKRRSALVATVPLNLRAAGGTGDRERTLAVCHSLVDDRDEMVVKALSWALRELAFWDPDSVEAFINQHRDRVAASVRREVTNKLNTGLKSPQTRRS